MAEAKQKESGNFAVLPDELLLPVFVEAGAKAVRALRRTCNRLRLFSYDDILWTRKDMAKAFIDGSTVPFANATPGKWDARVVWLVSRHAACWQSLPVCFRRHRRRLLW